MNPLLNYSTLFLRFDFEPPVEVISAAAMAQPYRRLLDHANHMTVTIEQFYGQPVTLRVLESKREGDNYSRKILLLAGGRVVQFGIVAIDLSALPAAAREAIESQSAPLGRILIENGVLTTVQPVAFLKVTADEAFADYFSVPAGTLLFGRVGAITAGGRAAIEVIEVLAPVAEADTNGG